TAGILGCSVSFDAILLWFNIYVICNSFIFSRITIVLSVFAACAAISTNFNWAAAVIFLTWSVSVWRLVLFSTECHTLTSSDKLRCSLLTGISYFVEEFCFFINLLVLLLVFCLWGNFELRVLLLFEHSSNYFTNDFFFAAHSAHIHVAHSVVHSVVHCWFNFITAEF